MMVVVMVMIVMASGHRAKKNGAHHTFNGCKWRTMGVSCRHEDLPGETRKGSIRDCLLCSIALV